MPSERSQVPPVRIYTTARNTLEKCMIYKIYSQAKKLAFTFLKV